MKYALKLAEDSRILSVTYEQYAPADAVLVDELPDGNMADYRYVDGEFIYDPEPKQPKAEPTVDDVLNTLLGVTE